MVTSTGSVSECRAGVLELILAEVADGDETDAREIPFPFPFPLPLPLCPILESRRMMLPRRADEAQESLRVLMLPLLLLWLFAVAEAGRRPRFLTSRL